MNSNCNKKSKPTLQNFFQTLNFLPTPDSLEFPGAVKFSIHSQLISWEMLNCSMFPFEWVVFMFKCSWNLGSLLTSIISINSIIITLIWYGKVFRSELNLLTRNNLSWDFQILWFVVFLADDWECWSCEVIHLIFNLCEVKKLQKIFFSLLHSMSPQIWYFMTNYCCKLSKPPLTMACSPSIKKQEKHQSIKN